MTPTTRVIRIKIEQGEAGLLYATSPDLKGLLVAEPTMAEMEVAIPETIASLILAGTGERVVVTRAQDVDADPTWVAIPVSEARFLGSIAEAEDGNTIVDPT